LYFDDKTRTLTFRPEDPWDQGKIFYFQLVVKEKNSDVIMYPYYMNVYVMGTPPPLGSIEEEIIELPIETEEEE